METTLTFAGALSQWLKLHTLGRKPGTQKFNTEIAGIVRKHWPGFFNGATSAITPDQVMEFAERVTHYCPSRWNAICSVLQFIAPGAVTLQRRPIRFKDRASLSHADYERLLEKLDARPRSQAGLVVRFLTHTGLRINEARQVRWADVDTDCLWLPASATKNGKPRAVPFVNGTRKALDELRAVATGPNVLPQAECKRSLKRACKDAGLPSLSHHDFRHLFATRCIQSGVDIPTVARWLGHRDGGGLLSKLYFHLVDEHSRAMAKKVVIALQAD